MAVTGWGLRCPVSGLRKGFSKFFVRVFSLVLFAEPRHEHHAQNRCAMLHGVRETPRRYMYNKTIYFEIMCQFWHCLSESESAQAVRSKTKLINGILLQAYTSQGVCVCGNLVTVAIELVIWSWIFWMMDILNDGYLLL